MIDKTTDEYKIECYKQALQMIIDIGFDYDGVHTTNDLKLLINELVKYAQDGLKLELPQYTTGDGKCVVHYHGEQELPEEEWNSEVKQWFEYNKSISLFKQAINEMQNMSIEEYDKLYQEAVKKNPMFEKAYVRIISKKIEEDSCGKF